MSKVIIILLLYFLFFDLLISKLNQIDSDYFLNLLEIIQSEESKDYIQNKKQFQLDKLITEHSHPITKDLSYISQNDTLRALNELLKVDQDITNRINSITQNEEILMNQAKTNIKQTLLNRGRIYVYGTGSTGRLAKQIEKIWRKFWINLEKNPFFHSIKNKLQKVFSNYENIQDKIIADITGGDRALIKSLEGFEDLQVIGKIQLDDYQIDRNDLVLAVTEGGETSAVIGVAKEASEIINDNNKVYFVFNNPTEILIEFERCKEVILNDKITKINFTTGPQSITGSTRMQATSSQTFVIATLIESALSEIFFENLDENQLKFLNFYKYKINFKETLNFFEDIRVSISNKIEKIAEIAELEYEAYNNNLTVTYYGNELFTTLFIDVTERAPTFSLDPLDSIYDNESKSWIQLATAGRDLNETWFTLLLRDFKGLKSEKYLPVFEKIEDPYLKKVAIESLKSAGDNQKYLYDFSVNQLKSNHKLGIAYILFDELVEFFFKNKENSYLEQWISKVKISNPRGIIIVVVGIKSAKNSLLIEYFKNILKDRHIIIKDFLISSRNYTDIDNFYDPMNIKQIIALKLILNTQSSFIMAKLNRILGNSMVYVRPSNLKLIGRASYLMNLHINDKISNPDCLFRKKNIPLIKYEEANAILYDVKNFFTGKNNTLPIIPMAYVRIFENLLGNLIGWQDTIDVLNKYDTKLSEYILNRLKC